MTTLAGAASAVDGTWIISLIRDILTKRQTDLGRLPPHPPTPPPPNRRHQNRLCHHCSRRVAITWPGWMFCYNTVQSVHSHMSIVVPHAPRDTRTRANTRIY